MLALSARHICELADAAF